MGDFCKSCPKCQRVSYIWPPRVPLVPMPIVAFDRIAMNIAGPFPNSSTGHHFVLVILDYAMRFPEAIPMKSVVAPKVAEELIKWTSQVGIPQEILMDHRSTFMSRVLKGVCATLKIWQLKTLVYPPQMEGLVKRFNHTLKGMIRACIHGDP